MTDETVIVMMLTGGRIYESTRHPVDRELSKDELNRRYRSTQ